MLAIRNLELHVAHACNLACESCSHYSNQGHKGIVPLEEAERWMEPWSTRLAPARFSLLGGEPAIHPRLSDFVPLARRYWPEAQLRLVSNGFLLGRHPDLPRRMAEAGNSLLVLSIHHGSEGYVQRLAPVLRLLGAWERDHGIGIAFSPSYRQWTRRYKGFGAGMEPYDDHAPRKSWESCRAKYCPQLFEGCLWKCAPLAYLGMQNRKFGLSGSWSPYLSYRPLAPSCPERELAEFFAREEESGCAMCPAAPERFELPPPAGKIGTADRAGCD